MNRRMGIFLAIALFVVSCRQETVGDAIHRLRDNAYTRSMERGNHRIELRFIPETLYYLTSSALDTDRVLSNTLLDSIKAKGDLQYGLMFTLTLSPKDDTLPPLDFRNDVVFGLITGQENYRNILDEFLNGLSGKIWLEAGGKRHSLRTHLMTNSWGMEKSRVFTLLFDPIPDLLPDHQGRVTLVVENLVPGQARDKIDWDLPLNRNDFI